MYGPTINTGNWDHFMIYPKVAMRLNGEIINFNTKNRQFTISIRMAHFNRFKLIDGNPGSETLEGYQVIVHRFYPERDFICNFTDRECIDVTVGKNIVSMVSQYIPRRPDELVIFGLGLTRGCKRRTPWLDKFIVEHSDTIKKVKHKQLTLIVDTNAPNKIWCNIDDLERIGFSTAIDILKYVKSHQKMFSMLTLNPDHMQFAIDTASRYVR